MPHNIRYGRINSIKYKKRQNKRQKRYLIAIVVIAGISVLVYALRFQDVANAADVGEGSHPEMEKPAVTGIVSEKNEDVGKKPDVPVMTENVEEKNEDTDKEADIESAYDYTRPVPESDSVSKDYFNDAVFIGNSRTEGLILNTGLSNAIAYTHKGLMVDTVFTKPVINMDGEKLSVMEALRKTDFSKVYIMFGINETGWKYEEIFINKYEEIIDEIREINPKASIYVQEILPVTDSISKTHSYVKNEKIDEYNKLIFKMAEEKQVYYIDTGNAVAQSNACLPEDAATDGIHLKKSYCEKWLEYLKTHTVVQ